MTVSPEIEESQDSRTRKVIDAGKDYADKATTASKDALDRTVAAAKERPVAAGAIALGAVAAVAGAAFGASKLMKARATDNDVEFRTDPAADRAADEALIIDELRVPKSVPTATS